MDDAVGHGAALVHKHMGNDSVFRTRMLHKAMSTILINKRRSPWFLVVRGPVSKDIFAKSLYEKVVESAPSGHKLHTVATGAVTKAVRERLEAGTASKEDVRMIYWLMGQVLGQAD